VRVLFVYRHLGLVECNIAIMKRFIPLLIWVGCEDDSDENPLYDKYIVKYN